MRKWGTWAAKSDSPPVSALSAVPSVIARSSLAARWCAMAATACGSCLAVTSEGKGIHMLNVRTVVLFALVYGIAFTVFGIGGFIPGVTQMAPDDPNLTV